MRERTPRWPYVALLLAIAFAALLQAMGSVGETAAAPDVPGKLLFVRDGNIWQWSHGDAQRLVVDGAASDARWSPDGRQILYVRSGNSYSDLVLFNLDTGLDTPLTYNRPDYEEGTPEYAQTSAWVIDPDWSPAGIIGYMSDASSPDETFQLWLSQDAAGSGYLAPAAQFEDNIDSLSLSPDASVAAYTVQARELDGTSATYPVLRDLTDGIAYPLLEGESAFDPAIAPDNQHIAVAMRAENGTSDIWLLDRASDERVRITTDLQATSPAWSPDGQWLAFVRMIDYQFEVWLVPMTGATPGNPEKLFRARGFDATSGISWSLAEP